MGEKIVVDTDILIDILRNKPDTVALVRDLEADNDLGTTDINIFELYHGAYKSEFAERNVASAKGLLGALFRIGTNEAAMEIAARVLASLERRGLPIDLRDLLIGSVCLVNSCAIKTRNRKHFERIPGLKVL